MLRIDSIINDRINDSIDVRKKVLSNQVVKKHITEVSNAIIYSLKNCVSWKKGSVTLNPS